MWALVVLAAAFFLVPIAWLALESTRPAPGGFVGHPLGFGSFRLVVMWWHALFAGTAVGGSAFAWLENSALYSGSGVLIAVALGLPAGYGLATLEFVGRRLLLTLTMIAMLIPSNALALPLVLEANAVHMLGSPFAVILPYGLFPFGVYIAYLYFNTPQVHHLIASARIDGCTEWQSFRRVALPLSMPVIGLIVLLDFVASWTNYFLPFLMYSPWNTTGRYPVALGIAQQLMAGPTFGSYVGNLQLQTVAPAPEAAMLLLVTAVPPILVLVIAQRWIVSGRLGGVLAV
jgi:multiple sugar transport system permease protein